MIDYLARGTILGLCIAFFIVVGGAHVIDQIKARRQRRAKAHGSNSIIHVDPRGIKIDRRA